MALDSSDAAVAYGAAFATPDVSFAKGTQKTQLDCGLPFNAQRLYQQNFIAMPSTMVRKSVLKEVGGFDEALHHDGLRGPEDLELWLRLTLAGYKFVRCPVVGLVYNMGGDRLTAVATNSGAMKHGMEYIENKLHIKLNYPF
jgi:GT2 family glycosyltransferase